jgi:hypothetical protein
MNRKSCIIEVKVLAHWLIQKYSGPAVLAAIQPRFVVALEIKGTKALYAVPDSEVAFNAHQVAFFAVSSITKTFANSDVLGKEFRLRVDEEEIAGTTTFTIGIAG